MTILTTRAGKGSPLSNNEMDANLNNLNDYKVEQTSGTGSAKLPSGTTAERDATPQAGWTRFNTTLGKTETYTGTRWITGGIENAPVGIGYGPGAGGTVTQATSKSTAVTLNKPNGTITTNAGSLAAGAFVFFQFNNSLFSYTSGDSLIVESNIPASYTVKSGGGGAGFTYIVVKNDTGNPLADALVLTFKLLKGATS